MAKKIDLAEGLTHFKAKENASIAITEATSTASAPHKAGEYFYYKGDLVIATADIAQGGTITLNTNCKKQPLADSVCELKTAVDTLYIPNPINDSFGSNASIEKNYWSSNVTASWNSSTKTLTENISTASSSALTSYVFMKPKLVSGHTYKLAVKYGYSTDKYTYIGNFPSTSNFNNADQIIWNVLKENGNSDVATFTTTKDGWLGFGVRMQAEQTGQFAWNFALYDVTGMDVSGVSNDSWLALSDTVLNPEGLIPEIEEKAEFAYSLDSNVSGEKWTALGDSLTAADSGGQYLGYVKNSLGLSAYNNCGVGGTTVSGAEASSAMYQDSRINALNADSNAVTIMGGTNDIYQEYYEDHPTTQMTGWGDITRSNHDVTTFVGAYNVMISKILYKFSKVSGYYNDVDYTGITQVETAINNFRLILITPPQKFHVSTNSLSEDTLTAGITKAHDCVKQIAELWALPCVDTWEMGMNDMNKSLFFTDPTVDATHFNAFGQKRIASLLIDKALQISRYE